MAVATGTAALTAGCVPPGQRPRAANPAAAASATPVTAIATGRPRRAPGGQPAGRDAASDRTGFSPGAFTGPAELPAPPASSAPGAGSGPGARSGDGVDI